MKWLYLCSLCLLLGGCVSPAVVTTSSPAASSRSAAASASLPTPFATEPARAAETSPAAAPPTPISATEVIRYVAPSAAAPSAQASCGPSIAISRADAYRCMQENRIYDPCFATADAASVVCEPDPATDEPGVSLGLSEPLPTLTVLPARPSDAWLVQLQDGSVCSPFTGSRAEIDGKLTTYSCATPDGAGAVLLGDLTVGTVWSAEKAIISVEQSGPQLKQSERLAIWRVWQ